MSNLSGKNSHGPSSNFLTWQFINSELFEWGERQDLLEDGSCYTAKTYTIDLGTLPKHTPLIFLPALPQKTYRVNVHWGKGNSESFGGLLDTNFEMTLIPGNPPKISLWFICCMDYVVHVINEVLAHVFLTVGPVGPQNCPVVISKVKNA